MKMTQMAHLVNGCTKAQTRTQRTATPEVRVCSWLIFRSWLHRTGRGHHVNYGVTVSGDIYNLKCENRVNIVDGFSEGMTSGAI